MAKLDITYVNLQDISDRDNSQRKKIESVEDLMDSIQRIGLLHPIVIDNDKNLIAGGRRLAAYRALAIDNPKHYSQIPTVQRTELSISERKVIELEENIKRMALPWQDEAIAVVELDQLLSDVYPDWKQDDRAAYVGYSRSWYFRLLSTGKAILGGNERIANAGGLRAAMNILERERARQSDNVMNDLYEVINESGEGNSAPEQEPQSNTMVKEISDNAEPVKKQVIVQGDFLDWAPNYTGPKFNLIHCDFPYGIDHGKSAQGGAKSRWDAYEDGEDVYWTLLRTLLVNRDKIMHRSCHIMFWFSMKFYSETINMFNQLAPEMDVNYTPLIWHKTDNKGIIRDVEHTPRHVYETALFITRGDRQIIKAVGDTYGAPTRKTDALHISEKPVPVLRHFMQLCVDGYSEVLDPTAGSGSAIRAANSMGAKRVLGLELNQEYADGAQQEFEQQLALESLTKKGNDNG